MKMEQMSLIKACKTHLGLPGENLKDFSEGYKKLTDKDREDLTKEFAKIGIEIVAPQATAS